MRWGHKTETEEDLHRVSETINIEEAFDVTRVSTSGDPKDNPKNYEDSWWITPEIQWEYDAWQGLTGNRTDESQRDWKKIQRRAVTNAKLAQKELSRRFYDRKSGQYLDESDILVMPVTVSEAWSADIRHQSWWEALGENAKETAGQTNHYLDCLHLVRAATEWRATVITAHGLPLRYEDGKEVQEGGTELPVGMQLITTDASAWRALALAQVLDDKRPVKPADRYPRRSKKLEVPAEWMRATGPALADRTPLRASVDLRKMANAMQ